MNPSSPVERIDALFAFVILAALVPVGLTAQTTARTATEPFVPQPAAEEAISVLKSPYCPGLMLEVCSSYRGALLRDSLQTMAEEGWSADSLVAWVLANHGDSLLALPRVAGRGLVAWVVPPAAVLFGLGAVALFLRAVMARGVAVEGGSEDLSEEEEAALRDALRKLDADEEPIF
jgi:cytochrome c-type biogenesis protein CcmH/NrfF